MTDQFHDSDEVPELRALPREAAPPPKLEDRVVAELHRTGLLRAHGERFRSMLLRSALAAAACVALFVAGWLAGSRREAGPAPEGQPSYALLLRAGPDYRPGTEADEQQRVKEYGAWARRLHEAGVAVRGEKLRDDTRTLVARDRTVVLVEGPPGETDPVLGFFLIQANSLEQALDIARGCPHLRHGGTIEVRPIDPT